MSNVELIRTERINSYAVLVCLPPDWELYRKFRNQWRRSKPAPQPYCWIVLGEKQSENAVEWARAMNEKRLRPRRRETVSDEEWNNASR